MYSFFVVVFLLIVVWWNMMQKDSQSLLCCWCGKIFASLFTVSNTLPQAKMSIVLKIQVQKGKSTITGNNLKVLAIFIQCLIYFWCDLENTKSQLYLEKGRGCRPIVKCWLYRMPKVSWECFLVFWLKLKFTVVTWPFKSVSDEDCCYYTQPTNT